MKKSIVLFALIVITCMSSCGKLPKNGRLDGMWQLMKIEKVGEDAIDTKEDRLFYSVQLDLLALQKVGIIEYLGRFTQTQDSLFVYDFRLKADNAVFATKEQLQVYGLNNTSERFGIEKLDDKKLILRSEKTLLTLRKF
ncbi:MULTISPECIES: lipocalin-like domain-containing protein [unclassified Bacteroides]|jgi:hypothetical protein|uniref:lipocalin-like domain-containing protein n=1 Tax=unclassified Bacteroides TaxID=2646097 RepID=UPI000E87BF70|nr:MULTISPECIES: lipocalin-like domain-containing protein [unclassified Bacteroides]RGN50789.1 hypothetical protein DXB63_02545 [Bacteroides sp. OM05-12]RHR76614.1 hypothetical protein DWW69_08300 [Bacteroides sp. AF16-49]